MAGSDTLSETLEIQNQLKGLLNTGGFNLRKRSGNHPPLLQEFPMEDIEVALDYDHSDDQRTPWGWDGRPKLRIMGTHRHCYQTKCVLIYRLLF